MTRLKMGLVGLGMAVTPHAKSLIDLADRIEFAGAFSPSRERRDGFAAKFALPVRETLDELLDDPSVQAMMVLTPPNTHLEIVRRCAAAGKHILLEKPVEITTALVASPTIWVWARAASKRANASARVAPCTISLATMES